MFILLLFLRIIANYRVALARDVKLYSPT